MGGRPIAVVDAFWSRAGDAATPLLEGLAKASQVYGVPVVGGHSNRRNDREQLAVAILGRAKKLLTSFDALPGESLVAAIDLRGNFHEPYAYWDASSGQPSERLRADLDVLPTIAEAGWSRAAKDISMAGVVGTTLMLLECSGIGAHIDLDAIPRPEGVALERWLTAFPSYGFLLSVPAAMLPSVLHSFQQRDIGAAVIGQTNSSRSVTIGHRDATELLWNFDEQALIGCGAKTKIAGEFHHA
jgi:AIR synthase-related protein